MNRRPGRSYVACILVLTFNAPGIASLFVAAHVATHHSAAHHSEAAATGLDVVLHGHHHEAGTPSHDHRLVVPAAVSGRELKPSPPATVASWLVRPINETTAACSACRIPTERGLGPPHPNDAAIVILRI